MRYIYTVGFYIVLPIVFLRAIWRARNTIYFKRAGERIGLYKTSKLSCSIWLHAVSYGEAVAAEPLIKKLKQYYPHLTIVITTMTLTGALRVQQSWHQDAQIQHLFLPYDVPSAIKRLFKHINPKVAIIMETEIWPNLLHFAGKKQLPVLLANARLSPRSFKGYQRASELLSPYLKSITHIAAQTEDDAKRFVSLGVPATRVTTAGNLKFDITPHTNQVAAGLALKKQLPFKHILTAASTHHDEEEQLLDIFAHIKKSFPNTLLVIVPRHPERFNEVAKLSCNKGEKIARRSLNEVPNIDTTVYLGDTMGELYFFYAMADIAFVGGSLVPVGGHNLLEPAAVKLPIVTGPHLFNFTAIRDLLSETGSLQVAEDKDKLHRHLTQLLKDESHRYTVGKAGHDLLEQHRGAAERCLNVITSLLH